MSPAAQLARLDPLRCASRLSPATHASEHSELRQVSHCVSHGTPVLLQVWLQRYADDADMPFVRQPHFLGYGAGAGKRISIKHPERVGADFQRALFTSTLVKFRTGSSIYSSGSLEEGHSLLARLLDHCLRSGGGRRGSGTCGYWQSVSPGGVFRWSTDSVWRCIAIHLLHYPSLAATWCELG